MIHLTKDPQAPQSLVANAAAWTQVLLDHDTAGTKPTKNQLSRYNNDEIKGALKAETKGKCAYCESRFEHVTYGDIEHIVPKKLSHRLRFDWTNLTIACDVCNTGKGEKEDLVDPYECDPEQLFVIAGPSVLPRPESNAAVRTEIALKLNRAPLIEKRTERIRALHTIVMLAKNHSDEGVRRAIIDDLKDNEAKDEQEFAAVSRAYIRELEQQGVI